VFFAVECRVGRSPPVLAHRRGPNHNAFRRGSYGSLHYRALRVRVGVCARISQGAAMSTRPVRPVPGPSGHPGDPASAVPSPSIPRRDSGPLGNARSALGECSDLISLVEVTVRSLESQDIACAEQNVLNRAIQMLSSLHDWLYDRMWSEPEAEHALEREDQP
jgi:hypothetical protein